MGFRLGAEQRMLSSNASEHYLPNFAFEICLILPYRYNISYVKYREKIMSKMLISVPDQLAIRMKSAIPQRQRSRVIVQLLEKEIDKREKALYECALAVEKDEALHREMKNWDATLQDGLENESW